MNYLVTGASGFVGSNLLKAFENHDDIKLFAWDRKKAFGKQLIAKEGIIHLASWRESYNIFTCQHKSESSYDWKWKTI